MTARRGAWALVWVGLGVSLLLAGVVSRVASSDPDGLMKVAADHGLLGNAQDSATADSPLAGYGRSGISDDRLATAVAGIVGVALTAALAFGLFLWLGRRRGRTMTAVAEPARGTR